MQFSLTLIGNPIFIDLPVGLAGWFGWFTLLGFVLALLGYNLARNPIIHPQIKPINWLLLFFFLLILVPLTSLFLVTHLPSNDSLPPPGRPVDLSGPSLILFIGLPFALASGFLGTVPTFVISLFTGLLVALWDTHNPFTPLEFTLIALLFMSAVRQRYSSREFHLLRIPLVTGIVLALFYPALFISSNIFFAGGDVANRLDFAFTHVWLNSLAMGVQLITAGFIATLAALALPDQWGSQDALYPSPMERSLSLRFLYTMSPVAILIFLTLMVSNWILAGNAAREMLQTRMANAAGLSAETIPFFLESGHSLIQQLAQSPNWLTGSPEEDLIRLQQARLSVPFFNQMFLVVPTEQDDINVVASFPQQEITHFSENELIGIELAILGVPVQNYALPPVDLSQRPIVSFIA